MREHLLMCGLGSVLTQAEPVQSSTNILALSMIRSNVDDDQITAIEDLECVHATWSTLHASHSATCNERRMHIRGQLSSLQPKMSPSAELSMSRDRCWMLARPTEKKNLSIASCSACLLRITRSVPSSATPPRLTSRECCVALPDTRSRS
jgi:hypothetical protein